MLKIGDFNIFKTFFSTYFFQLAFLGSAGTKQNFIFLVKSQKRQRGKRNMQKMTFDQMELSK